MKHIIERSGQRRLPATEQQGGGAPSLAPRIEPPQYRT